MACMACALPSLSLGITLHCTSQSCAFHPIGRHTTVQNILKIRKPGKWAATLLNIHEKQNTQDFAAKGSPVL